MKITFSNYHNTDYFVKIKKINFPVHKQSTVSDTKKQEVKDESYIALQEMRRKVAEKLEEKFKEIAKKNYIVNISIHEKTKQYVIKILDAQTKEVIREMPWEKFLDMIAYMVESLQKHQLHGQQSKSNPKVK